MHTGFGGQHLFCLGDSYGEMNLSVELWWFNGKMAAVISFGTTAIPNKTLRNVEIDGDTQGNLEMWVDSMNVDDTYTHENVTVNHHGESKLVVRIQKESWILEVVSGSSDSDDYFMMIHSPTGISNSLYAPTSTSSNLKISV